MEEISSWFKREVWRWRSGAALVWTVVTTGPLLYTAVALAAISPLHPLHWIGRSVLLVFSTWTWPYVAVVMVAVAVFSVQNSKQFTVVPVVYSSRWHRLCGVVHPRSLYYVVCTGLLSGVVAVAYTSLVRGRYGGLSSRCQEGRESCLNEAHIFIVMGSFCIGVCYKISAILNGQSHLSFSVIQQSKLFQMKRFTLPIILKSGLKTLHRLKYYYLFYYLFLGTVVQNFFSRNFDFKISEEVAPLNTLTGLLDLSLFWHSLVCGTLVLSLLAISTQIFKLYYTEWHQFPVETTIQQYKNLCLHNALTCQKDDSVQYLGYLDLQLLARHSFPRRQLVFSLTQLGGHPQNWSQLSGACLGLLGGFVAEVQTYNNKVMADGSMKHLAADSSGSGSFSGSAGTNGLRQRNTSAGINNNTATATSPVPGGKSAKKPGAMELLVSDLKKRKVVAFFLAEDPDACSRRLFAKSQLYIWAVEALSHLACASYSEDRFGVVQKTLPEIVETLLNLQEQVEKHFRLVSSIGGKRCDGDSDVDTEAALRNLLKSSLKGSLYRIVRTFNTHIRAIPLSPDHMRRINHFLDYKE